jgi:hypothetical protein
MENRVVASFKERDFGDRNVSLLGVIGIDRYESEVELPGSKRRYCEENKKCK